MVRSAALMLVACGVMVGCSPAVTTGGKPVKPPLDHTTTASAETPVPAINGGFSPIPLELGAKVMGALLTRSGDNILDDGSLGDDYVVWLKSGQTITATVAPLEGASLPSVRPYVGIRFDDKLVSEDAAQRDGQSAEVTASATEDGYYIVRVSSAGRGLKEGSYSLSVR